MVLGVGKGVLCREVSLFQMKCVYLGWEKASHEKCPCQYMYPKEGTRKSLIKDVILTVEAELLEKRDRRIQEMEEKMQKQDKEIADLVHHITLMTKQ